MCPDMRSMVLCLIVTSSQSSPTAGSPATLRYRQKNPHHDLTRGPSHRFKKFPPRTLQIPLSLSPLPPHLLQSKATPPSPSNSMNARQVKWKSRTTWPSFLSASSASNFPQRWSLHPVRWCLLKAKLQIGWSKAMLAWWGGGHMLKTCIAQTVIHHF